MASNFWLYLQPGEVLEGKDKNWTVAGGLVGKNTAVAGAVPQISECWFLTANDGAEVVILHHHKPEDTLLLTPAPEVVFPETTGALERQTYQLQLPDKSVDVVVHERRVVRVQQTDGEISASCQNGKAFTWMLVSGGEGNHSGQWLVWVDAAGQATVYRAEPLPVHLQRLEFGKALQRQALGAAATSAPRPQPRPRPHPRPRPRPTRAAYSDDEEESSDWNPFTVAVMVILMLVLVVLAVNGDLLGGDGDYHYTPSRSIYGGGGRGGGK
ncbi:hypothetical protein [Buchananella hordeovulneris]|uniref:hypothetical protein n=1 Tax=Buchananella hordeovulneris TaxID=52770 RepID=UPI0026DD7774|nr:hypothetical protein [Buchananella hordeovulneris]MDO5081703.1 hypothetical protein [Buchananella hordeovulneris]